MSSIALLTWPNSPRVKLCHNDVIVNKNYRRFHLSRRLAAMLTGAKTPLFCCLAVNRRSFIVTFTALFSSIMECVALGTILNGTWRVYVVAFVLH